MRLNFRREAILYHEGSLERRCEMDKAEQEKQNRKKSNEKFNSITQKVKPENQNQTYNSVREGLGPNGKRKPD